MTNTGTPLHLFHAIDRQFGPLVVDLAATADDTCCLEYITPEENSLVVSWVKRLAGRRGWLNAPFTTQYVEDWAAKCLVEARLGAQFAAILPVHLHHDWWWEVVRSKVWGGSVGIYVLAPQLTADGLPADLAIYTFNIGVPGLHRFWWEKGEVEHAD